MNLEGLWLGTAQIPNRPCSASNNDRRIDIGWMLPGDFDYTGGSAFVEMQTKARTRLQSLRVFATGCVAFRDPVHNGHYSLDRFEAMLEATFAFAERLYEENALAPQWAAVQAAVPHANRMEIQSIHGLPGDSLKFKDKAEWSVVPATPQVETWPMDRHKSARGLTTSLSDLLR